MIRYSCAVICLCFTALSAEEAIDQPSKAPLIAPTSEHSDIAPFHAFTGRVTRPKVRLRHQPHLEGHIVRETNQGELLIVVDKADDFYAVLPPEGTKAYVYRTYILDNTVEGDRVNVRLEPSLEGVVIDQLNSGDLVHGKVSEENPRWLEIEVPPSTRFYVYKDFVENVGDPSLIAALEKRRNETETELTVLSNRIDEELQKPYEQIDLDPLFAALNQIINTSSEIPEYKAQAQTLLNELQQRYLDLKIGYLENQKALDPSPVVTREQTEIEKIAVEPQTTFAKKAQMTAQMELWVPTEEAYYRSWSIQNDDASKEAFYSVQEDQARTIEGKLKPYDRVIRNKPGDFLLVSPNNDIPVAFLYSTRVDLQNLIGHNVRLKVAERPNHNFAYPAYFVLSVE